MVRRLGSLPDELLGTLFFRRLGRGGRLVWRGRAHGEGRPSRVWARI